jgi:hypothetical protein
MVSHIFEDLRKRKAPNNYIGIVITELTQLE